MTEAEQRNGPAGPTLPDRAVPPSAYHVAKLVIGTHAQARATLTVARIWLQQGRDVTSVFAVVSPGRLHGTAVTMREHPSWSEPDIQVRLRGAATARRLEPGRAEDHLLGADFTYSDLRFVNATAPTFPASPLKTVDAGQGWQTVQCSTSFQGRTPCVLTQKVDRSGVTVDATWAGPGHSAPFRRFEAFDLHRSDAYTMPTRMRVTRSPDGYSSEMTMQSRPWVDIDPCLALAVLDDPSKLMDLAAPWSDISSTMATR